MSSILSQTRLGLTYPQTMITVKRRVLDDQLLGLIASLTQKAHLDFEIYVPQLLRGTLGPTIDESLLRGVQTIKKILGFYGNNEDALALEEDMWLKGEYAALEEEEIAFGTTDNIRTRRQLLDKLSTLLQKRRQKGSSCNICRDPVCSNEEHQGYGQDTPTERMPCSLPNSQHSILDFTPKQSRITFSSRCPSRQSISGEEGPWYSAQDVPCGVKLSSEWAKDIKESKKSLTREGSWHSSHNVPGGDSPGWLKPINQSQQSIPKQIPSYSPRIVPCDVKASSEWEKPMYPSQQSISGQSPCYSSQNVPVGVSSGWIESIKQSLQSISGQGPSRSAQNVPSGVSTGLIKPSNQSQQSFPGPGPSYSTQNVPVGVSSGWIESIKQSLQSISGQGPIRSAQNVPSGVSSGLIKPINQSQQSVSRMCASSSKQALSLEEKESSEWETPINQSLQSIAEQLSSHSSENEPGGLTSEWIKPSNGSQQSNVAGAVSSEWIKPVNKSQNSISRQCACSSTQALPSDAKVSSEWETPINQSLHSITGQGPSYSSHNVPGGVSSGRIKPINQSQQSISRQCACSSTQALPSDAKVSSEWETPINQSLHSITGQGPSYSSHNVPGGVSSGRIKPINQSQQSISRQCACSSTQALPSDAKVSSEWETPINQSLHSITGQGPSYSSHNVPGGVSSGRIKPINQSQQSISRQCACSSTQALPSDAKVSSQLQTPLYQSQQSNVPTGVSSGWINPISQSQKSISRQCACSSTQALPSDVKVSSEWKTPMNQSQQSNESAGVSSRWINPINQSQKLMSSTQALPSDVKVSTEWQRQINQSQRSIQRECACYSMQTLLSDVQESCEWETPINQSQLSISGRVPSYSSQNKPTDVKVSTQWKNPSNQSQKSISAQCACSSSPLLPADVKVSSRWEKQNYPSLLSITSQGPYSSLEALPSDIKVSSEWRKTMNPSQQSPSPDISWDVLQEDVEVNTCESSTNDEELPNWIVPHVNYIDEEGEPVTAKGKTSTSSKMKVAPKVSENESSRRFIKEDSRNISARNSEVRSENYSKFHRIESTDTLQNKQSQKSVKGVTSKHSQSSVKPAEGGSKAGDFRAKGGLSKIEEDSAKVGYIQSECDCSGRDDNGAKARDSSSKMKVANKVSESESFRSIPETDSRNLANSSSKMKVGEKVAERESCRSLCKSDSRNISAKTSDVRFDKYAKFHPIESADTLQSKQSQKSLSCVTCRQSQSSVKTVNDGHKTRDFRPTGGLSKIEEDGAKTIYVRSECDCSEEADNGTKAKDSSSKLKVAAQVTERESCRSLRETDSRNITTKTSEVRFDRYPKIHTIESRDNLQNKQSQNNVTSQHSQLSVKDGEKAREAGTECACSETKEAGALTTVFPTEGGSSKKEQGGVKAKEFRPEDDLKPMSKAKSMAGYAKSKCFCKTSVFPLLDLTINTEKASKFNKICQCQRQKTSDVKLMENTCQYCNSKCHGSQYFQYFETIHHPQRHPACYEAVMPEEKIKAKNEVEIGMDNNESSIMSKLGLLHDVTIQLTNKMYKNFNRNNFFKNYINQSESSPYNYLNSDCNCSKKVVSQQNSSPKCHNTNCQKKNANSSKKDECSLLDQRSNESCQKCNKKKQISYCNTGKIFWVSLRLSMLSDEICVNDAFSNRHEEILSQLKKC